VKEKLSGRIKKEGGGILWQRSARKDMPTGIRVVYGGDNSNIYAM